jgi:hypothetical protein
MKFIKQLSALAIASAVLVGCGGSKPAPLIVKDKALPAWFTNPKQNDASYIYAVAGGKSDEEAKAKALAAMIAKLSVNVQSSFEKNSVVNRHGRNSTSKETLTSNIKTEVGKIGISNYEVVKSEKLGYKNHVAMVQASKAKLVATLKKSLKAKMSALDIKVNALASQDILKQLFSYKQAHEEATGLTTEIMVTGELDKGFDVNKNLNYINSIYTKYLDAKNNVRFYVAVGKNGATFADKIKNALAQEYTVSNSKSGATITIHCSSTLHQENTGLGFALANMNVKIDVMAKGKKIGGNVVLVKDRAKNSKKATLARGALSFGKEIKEKGIINILGIKL